MIASRAMLRHEARVQPAGNHRWALPIDEEEMGELYTLALETSALDGTGVDRLMVREWREMFRSRVMMGGCRKPTDLRIMPR